MISILSIALSAYAVVSPINVHVDGEGYMRFIRDGRVVYAKKATLVNINGDLGADGAKLLPEVAIPDSVSSITIDLSGNINAGSAHLGRLVLGIFPAGSTSSGIGSFVSFSDRASLTNPGEETAGVIRTDGATSIADIAADPKPAIAHASITNSKSFTVAIAGEGYFAVAGPGGTPCYTRNGAFKLSPDGDVETTQGFLLEPNITIPLDATNISVSATGVVSATSVGRTEPVIFGQLQLTLFADPNALTRLDSNLFSASAKSGATTKASPSQGGSGLIKFNGELRGDASTIAAAHSTPNTTNSVTHTKQPTTTKTADGPQIEIVVRQHSEVSGGNFNLGDIATITGPEDAATAYKKVMIGATAIAGTNRIIAQNYVILKLRGAGFQPGSYVLVVPDGADVARKTSSIAGEDIVAAALKAVQDKTGTKLQFTTSATILPIVAEAGDISLETGEPTLVNKEYHVLVTARRGGIIVGTRTITLTPPADLACIKMGDAVTVIFKSGSAVIEVQGKALGPGFAGQHIQVSIAGVGAKPTTQTGIVLDSGKVEVDL